MNFCMLHKWKLKLFGGLLTSIMVIRMLVGLSRVEEQRVFYWQYFLIKYNATKKKVSQNLILFAQKLPIVHLIRHVSILVLRLEKFRLQKILVQILKELRKQLILTPSVSLHLVLNLLMENMIQQQKLQLLHKVGVLVVILTVVLVAMLTHLLKNQDILLQKYLILEFQE